MAYPPQQARYRPPVGYDEPPRSAPIVSPREYRQDGYDGGAYAAQGRPPPGQRPFPPQQGSYPQPGFSPPQGRRGPPPPRERGGPDGGYGGRDAYAPGPPPGQRRGPPPGAYQEPGFHRQNSDPQRGQQRPGPRQYPPPHGAGRGPPPRGGPDSGRGYGSAGGPPPNQAYQDGGRGWQEANRGYNGASDGYGDGYENYDDQNYGYGDNGAYEQTAPNGYQGRGPRVDQRGQFEQRNGPPVRSHSDRRRGAIPQYDDGLPPPNGYVDDFQPRDLYQGPSYGGNDRQGPLPSLPKIEPNPVPRERMPQPKSPQAVAWDNPFPTFPPKQENRPSTSGAPARQDASRQSLDDSHSRGLAKNYTNGNTQPNGWQDGRGTAVPLHNPNLKNQPHRSNTMPVEESFSGMSIGGGYGQELAVPGAGNSGSTRQSYGDVFDDYLDGSSPQHSRRPSGGPRLPSDESMPDFDAARDHRIDQQLHLDGARGRADIRPPGHSFEPRSQSQPNYRDGGQGRGPAFLPPVNGAGGQDTAFNHPGAAPYHNQPVDARPSTANGQGQLPLGNGPANTAYGRNYVAEQRPGFSGPSASNGSVNGSLLGPSRSPSAGINSQNGPYQPPGAGPPRQKMSGISPVRNYSGVGSPPITQATSPPLNPDALPVHPGPARPGLGQGLPAGPAPIRQYAPVSHGSSQPNIAPPPRRQSAQLGGDAPVTFEELQRLRGVMQTNPNDLASQFVLAKKLIEASTVLVNPRAEQKSRARDRERYILEAHKILKRLAAQNNTDAMFYLADCLGSGRLGLAIDPKEAFILYMAAAKLNHAQAAYRVAVCCEMGQEEGGGTRRDPLKAIQWYKRAATLGDTPAMYKMGMIQLKGLLGQPKNPPEAVVWLKRAAERADEENPHALHELGLLFEKAPIDPSMVRDEAYAAQLFHQSASLGYKFSQFRLGAAYEYGNLQCPVDPRQSIAWYSKAAAQEEHQSELALSGWYLTGAEGVLAQSDTEAYLWARKAATAGLAKAEYAMGYYCEVGIGAPANLEDAKRWYWRAAAQNFPKARDRLEDLRKGGARKKKERVSRSAVNRQSDGDCKVM